MQVTIIRKWKLWRHRRRRLMATKQMQKRQAILQHGMQLYVQVLEACPTRISIAQMQLVRLQLHIRLLNNTNLRAISYTFITGHCAHLKGQYLRIRFLPGDLSHVVLIV